ncbi:ABC transporter permease [Aliikangiella sp. G2MR2-5]|uniref:ABC transporter permease n=1 Tax=Aliikangiella sp. G2MR2-5 TaxID=2788943 RepID=UPI0018AB2138|nr:FtsX-like permease family protein [Aliikangiella sp. G2MR2-5]
MEIKPILSALSRNKTGALLIALQIALTMTIIVNSVFMIQQRQGQMERESGIDEKNTFLFSYMGFADDFNEKTRIVEDLDYIRKMPGIVAAVQTNSAPLTGGGWSMGLARETGPDADGVGTAIYFVDEQGVDAFGVKLLAGRNFTADEIIWRERTSNDWPGQGVVTKALASDLFDGDWQAALGKTVYINETQPINIIGIVEKMQAPWNGWRGVERTLLVPNRTLFGGGRIMVRTEPGERDRLMKEVEEQLFANYKGRLIRNVRSMEEIRTESYQAHNGMNTILKVLIVCLTVVTALGIIGLASFSVNRRKKQIGTRRALGARKKDILRYFMLENFLITSVGVVVGAAMTIGLNMVLVDMLNLPKIDWYYIPAGMLLLWFIGQLAVFGPAKKACQISPALATRSV